MAVFRVEKNKGYTVMSNHHLRNKELSLPVTLIMRLIMSRRLHLLPWKSRPSYSGRISGSKR